MAKKSRKENKVAVSKRALMQRINRRIEADDAVLKATRGTRAFVDCGDYYLLSVSRGYIGEKHIDLEEFGRRVKALGDFECLFNG